MRVSLDLAEQKHIAIDRRQPIDRALQCQPHRAVTRRRRHIHRHVGVHHLAVPPRRPAPADVVAGVQQDAIHPRPQRRVAPERMPVLVRAQERLLHGVLGVRAIPQHVEREALHPGPVRLVECLECGQVDRHAARLSSCAGYSTGGQGRPFGGRDGGVISLRHGVCLCGHLPSRCPSRAVVNVRSETGGIPRPDTRGRVMRCEKRSE